MITQIFLSPLELNEVYMTRLLLFLGECIAESIIDSEARNKYEE